MSLDEEALESYVRAGRIAASIIRDASRIVWEGRRRIDVCEEVERLIVERGGKPAFPCNLCLDEVAAHFTSPTGDEDRIPEGSLVKLDVGVHIDGFIADTAVTLCFDDRYEPLAEAVEEALEKAVKAMKPGVKVSEVGRIVERVLRGRGFRPIENLMGHQVDRFNLHAGLSIPNVAVGSGRIRDGCVYAVEPFGTVREASGLVKSGRETYIFRCLTARRVKDEDSSRLLRRLWSNFRSLPFAERWVLNWRVEGIEVEKVWSRLKRNPKVIFGYPVLVEARRGVVAQSEWTVAIFEGEPYVVTEF